MPIKISIKRTLCVLNLLLFCVIIHAQNSYKYKNKSFASFLDYQKNFSRPGESFTRKEELLKKEFEDKGIAWPAKYLYIRSFKYDSELEVWVKNDLKDTFQLFKSYYVCALAGSMGPKRMEGDFQVPEGFYYINEFNPYSEFYLSLGLNYPNVSDRILSDSKRPGGAIYIHGSCVTVGCIPIMDDQVAELYILSAHAKNAGQDFIPVHILPIRFNVLKSVKYFQGVQNIKSELKSFSSPLEDAFNYFNDYKQIPVALINEKGEYIINNAPPKRIIEEKPVVKKEPVRPPLKENVQHRRREIGALLDAVHTWPQFPNGNKSYIEFLEQIGKDMVKEMPENMEKAFIQVSFIVDTDGVPVNFEVLKGLDAYFNQAMIIRLEEKMPNWTPATQDKKPVAQKMIQTITIEK